MKWQSGRLGSLGAYASISMLQYYLYHETVGTSWRENKRSVHIIPTTRASSRIEPVYLLCNLLVEYSHVGFAYSQIVRSKAANEVLEYGTHECSAMHEILLGS